MAPGGYTVTLEVGVGGAEEVGAAEARDEPSRRSRAGMLARRRHIVFLMLLIVVFRLCWRAECSMKKKKKKVMWVKLEEWQYVEGSENKQLSEASFE